MLDPEDDIVLSNRRRQTLLGMVSGPSRLWVILGALALLLALTSSASALSLEDIKRMASAGLDENTVISIIENSGDKFEFNDTVAKDLKKAGVSDRVINVIKAHAKGAATTDASTDVGTDTSGPEPLPAGVGNLGKLMAQGAKTAKQQFDIAAAATKRILAQQKTDQDSAKMQLSFQGVTNALRDFENVDKWQALATCHNFNVEFKPAPNTDEYYDALFCKGSAFNALELHNLAAPILRDVVMYGGERPHFVDAFDQLVASAEAAAYFPASLADLDKLYIDDKYHDFQNRFNFFVGRFFMDNMGEYERAIALLAQVSADSSLYPKALYATGVMQSNPKVKMYKTAVENFQGAIVAGEASEDKTDDEIVELAYLALARIAYEATNYDGALYYYNKVSHFSSRYPQALFESAWTYFLKGDHRQALGTFHSVASPYYDDHYFPDLWVLEATVYLNLCRYDEAKEALQTFQDVYLAKLPYLTQFLASMNDPMGYYQTVVEMAENRSANSELPTLFLEAVLADVEFFNLYHVVTEIDREVNMMKEVAPQLGAFGTDLLTSLERLQETKRFEAGLKTQHILKGIEDELRDWDVTSTEVSIEIDISEKDLDEVCLRLAAQGKPCEFVSEEATVLFLVADDWQFWPFEGEYWVDEVGNYKSYLGDRCNQVEAVAATTEP